MSKNNDTSYNGWNIGDICYRNNEKCKIKEIDLSTNPPSVVIEVLSDHHEINTEFSKLRKPQVIIQKNKTEMDPETKKDLAEIQQWFLGLTMVKDEDLTQFIPSILPKLLFKLNKKNIHHKLQSEILQMIQHISSRINSQQNGYKLIPIHDLIKMLFQHISYYNHDKSFYISSYFIHLSITFIDMTFKIYLKSLHSKHLETQSQNQRIVYPKCDLNMDDNDDVFINKQLIVSILNLLTLMDKVPNMDHSYSLFHIFVQILPFIKYSNDNIDQNAKVFSGLFEIDFNPLKDEMEQKQKEKQQTLLNEQNKILKTGYENNNNTNTNTDTKENDSESEDDEDDDDVDIDIDIDMNNDYNEDIVTKLTKDRDLNLNTAIILCHKTPVIALPHITMLMNYCTDFLLLRYVAIDKDKIKCAPPGLSKSIHDKISKHYSLCKNKLYLEELHKSIIDFLYRIGVVCEMISIEDVFIASLISKSNNNVAYIAASADRLYSKIRTEVNMEHQDIVRRLYVLYLGDTDKKMREINRRTPCGPSFKVSILNCLCKSNRACNEHLYSAIKVVFDALFGKKTYLKLKLNGLEFTQQIFTHASDSSTLNKLTPVFKTGLYKLLKVHNDAYVENDKVRSIAYSVLSQLSLIQNASKLFTKNLDILQLYFDRLQVEHAMSIKESILDGLKKLRECFKRAIVSSHGLSHKLLAFLLQRMDDKQISNRSKVVVLEWMNDIYPFNNAQIRMMNIFELNHSDDHIRQCAKQALLPQITNYKLQKYPLFSDFTNIAHKRIINNKISEIVMKETVTFAAKCLSGNAMMWNQKQNESESKSKSAPMLMWLELNDESNVFRNDVLYKSLLKQSKYIKCNGSNPHFLIGFEQYLHLLLYGIEHFAISHSKTETLHSIAFQHLIHVMCICGPSFADNNVLRDTFGKVLFDENNLNLFYQRLLNDSVLTRTQCAKLFAMMMLFAIKDQHNMDTMQRYQSMLFKSVASHVTHRLKIKSNPKPKDILTGTIQQVSMMDGALKGLSCILSAQLYDKHNITSEKVLISWLLTVFIRSKNIDLMTSSCFALNILGKYDIVRLLDKKKINKMDKSVWNDTLSVVDICCDDTLCDALSLIEYICLIITRYNKSETNVAESAINALSGIARGISNLDKLDKIEEYLYGLRKLPQEDLQLGIGSVWANIVFSIDNIVDDQRGNHLDRILNEICNNFMCYGNKLARCAACVWLLCIVRFSGHVSCIQERLLTIQTAFISSLADSNEFTVECASKGLAHCFEMAKKTENKDAQQILLNSLMSTLGKGKRKVHKDTEIQHKEGTATYKELCQIAKNLNSPQLAYRFLDLASNHSIWNSKRGAAFSLGSLLKISNELSDKMDEIIPILYRYKFDINPQIRSTMHNLWISVAGDDEDAIVAKHYDKIMMNVMDGLQSKEWRVRASTPLAVCTLIVGKRFNEIEKYLQLLIENLFLVVQDINSMVKKSAIQMTQSMLNLMERLCNTDLTRPKYIDRALNIIVPNLNIETRAKEVQLLSVSVVLKICTNKTGKHLCPHLKYLICMLLRGLSTLEPTALNYLAVQDQGEQFSNKIETARINMSRSNPLNNALDTCIDLIDDMDTINNVIPELSNIIRGGIGLNSIDASCKILNNLSTKRYLHVILRKHSKKVITALRTQIAVTSSAHLKNQYASVIGHWLLFAKKKYVVRIMELVFNLYFNDDVNSNRNEDKRILSAIIAYNISRYSLNVIRKYNNILALAFIAVHDLNTECCSFWIKTLDECGGKQICLIQNMDKTIELINKTLMDSFHHRKQTAIIAIKDLCELSCDDLDTHLLQSLIEQILQSLPGRIWDGKIKLFDALKHITKHCHLLINKDDKLAHNIIQSLLIQIKRTQIEYRIAAMNAFGEIVATLNDNVCEINKEIVVLDECIPIIESMLNEYNEKEKQFVSQTTTDQTKKMEMKEKHKKDRELLCCTLKCIGNIWSGNKEIQDKYLSFVINDCYIYYLKSAHWIVAVSIYKSIQSFTDRVNIEIMHQKLFCMLIEAVIQGLDDLKYTAVRHQALCSLYKLLKLAKDSIKFDLMENTLMNKIKSKIDFILNNDNQPIVVQQATKLRKDIFV